MNKLLQKGIPLILNMFGAPQSSDMDKLKKIIQQNDSTGKYIKYHGITKHDSIQTLYLKVSHGSNHLYCSNKHC